MATNKVIQQITQKVKIREKASSTGKVSLFLDWHDGNGKRTKEYLGLFLIKEPKNPFERQENKDNLAKAEYYRIEREAQYFKGEADEAKEQKATKNQDFTTYFENYLNNYTQKDKRVMSAVFLHFKAFAPPHIATKEITENFCINFKKHLAKNLNGESPSSYFARFKKMLRQATRDKLFRTFPAQEIKNTKTDLSLTKDVLSIEEVQALANAQCGNSEVKRAFLFACNTGLRFSDIKALKWKQISKGVLKMEQAKTKDKAQDGGVVEVVLNNTALSLLGKEGEKEQSVFKLPSHNGTLGNLEHWAKRAGIDKHITFHCARHTFGTLLAYYQTDIVTISKLLGHTSLKHTAKYVRISNEMKKRAVESIPALELK